MRRIDARLKEAASPDDERSLGDQIIDELLERARKGERWALEFFGRRAWPEKLELDGHLAIESDIPPETVAACEAWLGRLIAQHGIDDTRRLLGLGDAPDYKAAGFATTREFLIDRFRREPGLLRAHIDRQRRATLHRQLDDILNGKVTIADLEANEPERPQPRSLPEPLHEDRAGASNAGEPDPNTAG